MGIGRLHSHAVLLCSRQRHPKCGGAGATATFIVFVEVFAVGHKTSPRAGGSVCKMVLEINRTLGAHIRSDGEGREGEKR